MKKLSILFLITLLLTITGCESSTKTLTCKADGDMQFGKTTSTLVVKIREKEVKDMTLTMEMTLSDEMKDYKEAIMAQMAQKTDKIYSTPNGIRAIFGMGSDYFNTLGLAKGASYSEMKQILEIQGYECK